MAKKQSKKVEFADSAHRVWLAGLGALATAGAEGEKLFETLVQRGEDFGKQVDLPLGKAGARVRSTVEEARTLAGETLESISSTIDDTVASALRRLGVPSRSEIEDLAKRVEKLTLAVEGKKPRRVPRKSELESTPGTTMAKKTARRRTTVRKTAKPQATT